MERGGEQREKRERERERTYETERVTCSKHHTPMRALGLLLAYTHVGTGPVMPPSPLPD